MFSLFIALFEQLGPFDQKLHEYENGKQTKDPD